MNKCFTFLFLIVAFGAYSQKNNPILPIKEGKVVYTLIDTLESLSKEKIHDEINEWFVKRGVNTDKIIKLNDKTNGKIIANVAFTSPIYVQKHVFNYTYTLNIETTVKENKYRMFFTDIILTGQGHSGNIEQVLESITALEKSNDKGSKIMIDINRQHLLNVDSYINKLISILKSDIVNKKITEDF